MRSWGMHASPHGFPWLQWRQQARDEDDSPCTGGVGEPALARFLPPLGAGLREVSDADAAASVVRMASSRMQSSNTS